MSESKRAGPPANSPEVGETSSESESSRTPLAEVLFLPAAEKDLDKIGRGKHLAQVVRRIDALEFDPKPADAKAIQGEPYKKKGWNFHRVDVGEYRIVYDLDETGGTLTIITVAVIGARNDDKVYRMMARRFG